MEATRYHNFVRAENLAFQKTFWHVQRVGWVLMTFLIVAAALGLLGGVGILNDKTSSAAGFSINYRQVLRRDTGTTFSFQLPSGGSTAHLLIDKQFFKTFNVRSILPQPSSTVLRHGFYDYEFSAQPGVAPAAIVINAWPSNTSYGISHLQFGTDQQHIQTITQWELP